MLLSVEYPDASLAHTASLASETPRDSSSVQTAALEASETPSDKASDTNSDKHGDNNVPTADNISINLTQGVFDKFRMFKSHMFSVTGTVTKHKQLKFGVEPANCQLFNVYVSTLILLPSSLF